MGQQDDLSCRIATQGRGIKINLASGGGFRWLQTLRMWKRSARGPLGYCFNDADVQLLVCLLVC